MENELTKSPVVIIASSECGDWEVIYVDGIKKSENHNLSVYDVLFALGINSKTVEVSDEWLSKNGSWFPNNENELPPELP